MTDVLIWRRLLTTGGIVAVLVLVLGAAAELVLIGRTNAAARQRGVRAIQAHVDSVADSLTTVARALAERSEVREGITGDRPAVRRLFDVIRAEAETQSVPDISVTIYDARGTPRAWSGRPTELGPDRIPEGSAHFADAGQAGFRLIHVEPVVDSGNAVSVGTSRRLGSVVTERVLSPAPPGVGAGSRFHTRHGRGLRHAARGGRGAQARPRSRSHGGGRFRRAAAD